MWALLLARYKIQALSLRITLGDHVRVGQRLCLIIYSVQLSRTAIPNFGAKSV